MANINIANRKIKKDLAEFSVNADFVAEHAEILSSLTPSEMSGTTFTALNDAVQEAIGDLSTTLASLANHLPLHSITSKRV